MSSFPTVYGANIYLWVFLAVVSFWLLTEIIGGIIIPRIKRGGSIIHDRKNRLNFTTWIGWEAFFAFTIVTSSLQLFILPDYVYPAGIILILIGIGIRQWAVAVLGKYFSQVVGIQRDQKIIETGPYRYVRHPSYTGLLLIWIGIALSFQNSAAVAVAVISFALAYGYRMLEEEKFLVVHIGDSYNSYMERTKRIIPFIV
ncbi:MAG: hypothetical protein B2I17_03950 [Thermoplasmatales archaeon B_DKE]|nr:MAG: hypothetical protein B2I17_03950 [Thermoplasmatales archaeon B_DKE]